MNHLNVNLSCGLYLVATPIGSARDITLRALDVLASADVLAAEDTRTLRHLMDIHGIPLNNRPMVAYHDHNGPVARPKLLSCLAAGKSVAYASEAGSPLIADPGFVLARDARDAGFAVTTAPGPSAVIAALSVSGLPSDRFMFVGFLPATNAARIAELEALKTQKATLVLYESPKRLHDLLGNIALTLGGDRAVTICRELTKKFEEVVRGPAQDLVARYTDISVKGEIVVLIDGFKACATEEEIDRALTTAMQTMSLKDAAAFVAEAFRLNRRDVYQRALILKE